MDNGGSGIVISGGTSGDLVEGNFIGTNASGATGLGNSDDGVDIFGATDNTIGGTTTGASNTIADNKSGGLDIGFSGTSGDLVEGNFIGTNASGATGLGNSDDGVDIFGATDNTIGGTTTGASNTIADNKSGGLDIGFSGASGDLVEGNFIGTDASGGTGLGNSGDGVQILGGATDNTTGGTTTGAANMIAFNGAGVGITDSGTSGNLVQGNVISGNQGDGVDITGGASTNVIAGNHIGVDSAGTAKLANGGSGIVISGASDNTIGGATSGAGNVISANGNDGVWITGGATGTLVAGNLIGTNVNATSALGNVDVGVAIDSGASDNTIGGSASTAANVIAGNGTSSTSQFYSGNLAIEDSGTSNNLVEGNYCPVNFRLKGKQDRQQNGHDKSPKKSKMRRKITTRKRIKSTIRIKSRTSCTRQRNAGRPALRGDLAPTPTPTPTPTPALALRVCSKSPMLWSVSVVACTETDPGTSPRSAEGASTESC